MTAQDAYTMDERFMLEALAEARRASDLGEVPIGAVVVHGGKVIAKAHNLRECDEDPSAHAEFSAMVAASRVLGRWRLTGCTVYVTLEPCVMCAGLMVNARIDRCVYGAPDPKGGALGTLYDLSADARLNHTFAVTPGVLEDECSQMLRTFFAQMRARRAQGGGSLQEGDEAHLAKRQHARTRSTKGPRRELEAPLRPLKVLLAMDSFKGSATSEQVERWVAEGIKRVAPDADIDAIPLADGGEGTVAAIASALDGSLRTAMAHDPFGNPMQAEYLLMDDGAAVLEMASAAGMMLSGCTHDEALRASTSGVGEMVLDAVAAGARTVYLGLGGSATSDGGAGFLQALGARLLDAQGNPLPPGIEGLENLASIDLAPAAAALEGVSLVAWTDVDNPLVGKRGALRVFGPQKGLADLPTPRDEKPTLYEALDGWMVTYANMLDDARGRLTVRDEDRHARRFRSVAGVPGAGAAGGLGAAMLALGAKLTSGIDALLELVDFDERAGRVDLVVTGEGMIDGQTADGKAPKGVAARAKRLGKPVVAVVGGRAKDLSAVYAAGIDLVIPAARIPMPLERAMLAEETRRNLRCAGESAAKAYLLSVAPQGR